MNYTKYFIILCSLMTINNFTNDARYRELKKRYLKQKITPQEEKELSVIAAQRIILKKFNPNAQPSKVSEKLLILLNHPLFDNLYTVQVGNRMYEKCYLARYANNPPVTRWVTTEFNRRRARDE